MAELLGNAIIGSVKARPPILDEQAGGLVGKAADATKHALIPNLSHNTFRQDALCLQERVEAHNAQADAALPHSGVLWRRPWSPVRDRQRDFGAKAGSLDLQPGKLAVLRAVGRGLPGR